MMLDAGANLRYDMVSQLTVGMQSIPAVFIPHDFDFKKEGHIMAQIKGLDPVIVPRIPYVPIEPWEWFKENGLEDSVKVSTGPAQRKKGAQKRPCKQTVLQGQGVFTQS